MEYDDLITDVSHELLQSVDIALQAGIARGLCAGVGFGEEPRLPGAALEHDQRKDDEDGSPHGGQGIAKPVLEKTESAEETEQTHPGDTEGTEISWLRVGRAP